MILSHEHKFIFIKTEKTAGTSLEIYLSQVCSEADVVTPIIPHVEPHRPRNYQDHDFYNHMPARSVKELVPESTWDNYFKFCVERNPWEKTLSHFYMMKHRAGGELSLEEYFETGVFPKNYYKYVDADGNFMVDRVIDYEHLNSGLGEIFRYLGIPFNGSLDTRAKAEYRQDRRPASAILSAEQIDLIGETFRDEIALFNYRI